MTEPGTAQRRTAWVLFAPLACVVGVRWVLTWLEDRASRPAAWAPASCSGPGT